MFLPFTIHDTCRRLLILKLLLNLSIVHYVNCNGKSNSLSTNILTITQTKSLAKRINNICLYLSIHFSLASESIHSFPIITNSLMLLTLIYQYVYLMFIYVVCQCISYLVVHVSVYVKFCNFNYPVIYLYI